MRRGSGQKKTTTPKEAILGEESVDSDHTSSYRSVSTDADHTYSNNTPRSRMNQSRDQRVPTTSNTARKSTAPRINMNRSNREAADMELTRNRTSRISMAPPNRSDTDTDAPVNRSGRSRSRQQAQVNRGRVRKQPNPRRRKPGVQALKEIRQLQRTTNLLIAKLPFSRLIREILIGHYGSPTIRITRDALMALQESSEIYLVQFFEDAIRLAIHAKRVTLMVSDMILVAQLRNNWGHL